MVSGDDIMIKMRIEGSFYERLELWDFPFDKQDLTMSLAVNVRTTGNTPVTLAVADDVLLAVDMDEGMQLSQFFTIDTLKADDGSVLTDRSGKQMAKVDVVCTETGTAADRMFPAMNISIKIIRKPEYYVFNVTVPMIIFNCLAFLQFTISPEFVPERLSISLTLVLTVAAYKFAVASLVPALSYMTMLDECANLLLLLPLSSWRHTITLATRPHRPSVPTWSCSSLTLRLTTRPAASSKVGQRINPVARPRAGTTGMSLPTGSSPF